MTKLISELIQEVGTVKASALFGDVSESIDIGGESELLYLEAVSLLEQSILKLKIVRARMIEH